ncbi:MAG: cupredoxin domain-containing protein [Polyangiaceae bacterium]|nr:cupredoxin domain-containing protein [Polyangiaceae bacterium]
MKTGTYSKLLAQVVGLTIALLVLGGITFFRIRQKRAELDQHKPAHEYFIQVDDHGYHPEWVDAPAGERVRLTFTRTADDGCGQQLFFPSEHLRRDLPFNEPVSVEITMPSSGGVVFTCSMEMYKGQVIAK